MVADQSGPFLGPGGGGRFAMGRSENGLGVALAFSADKTPVESGMPEKMFTLRAKGGIISLGMRMVGLP